MKSVERGAVPSYKITEWDSTPIRGTFYDEDLQKVTVAKDDFFRVECVIRQQGNKVLVHWKGWPQKYDSWVLEKDIVSLHPKKRKRKRKT